MSETAFEISKKVGQVNIGQHQQEYVDEFIQDFVNTSPHIEAIFAKWIDDDELHLHISVKEHDDEVYEELSRFERSLPDDFPFVYFIVRAHQGRTFDVVPYGFLHTYFKQG